MFRRLLPESIATIPLAAFTTNGAAAVTHVFALWGIAQLIVGLIYIVAAVRWRSLIPLLYLLAAVEYLLRLLVAWIKPVETVGTAPGAMGNYLLPPILVVLLVLSMWRRRGTGRVPRE